MPVLHQGTRRVTWQVCVLGGKGVCVLGGRGVYVYDVLCVWRCVYVYGVLCVGVRSCVCVGV